MFNLIVSGNGEAWESEPFHMDRVRFGEYSGDAASHISLADEDTLNQLIGLPTLLMYELGATGPNSRVVRYGSLKSLVVRRKEVEFFVELDGEHGYIDRAVVQEHAKAMDVHRFEENRTHWAIKDGSIPKEVIQAGKPFRPERGIGLASAEFAAAVEAEDSTRKRLLKTEIAEFPPSIEKAAEFLRREFLACNQFDAMEHLNLKHLQGREVFMDVLRPNFVTLSQEAPFSSLWLLENYGTPLDSAIVDDLVDRCEAILRDKLAADSVTEPLSESDAIVLTRCLNSHLLQLRLRRLLNAFVDRLSRKQMENGDWSSSFSSHSNRVTAMMTVVQQRLGNDSHRSASYRAVKWLCNDEAYKCSDPVCVAFTLEAIRRSSIAEDLGHLVEEGEVHLLGLQEELGSWHAEHWGRPMATVAVLNYFKQAPTMLQQVDGFLLMSRDFYRKAEELAYEGGINNRRLSLIAVVHATEMFLYGVFERREDLGLSAFTDRGDQTVGLRQALHLLQERLRHTGSLVKNSTLSYRDQLSSMVGLRDMVIHRAGEVSEEELYRSLKFASRFIHKHGRDLISLELLQ